MFKQMRERRLLFLSKKKWEKDDLTALQIWIRRCVLLKSFTYSKQTKTRLLINKGVISKLLIKIVYVYKLC
jgi:hypothetical protein